MIAIIPARGGSKGLPGKNIKKLLNKPLIAYTIEAALKSDAIDRVIVSTDSIEIAAIARSCGAEVPFLRPDYLSTDTTLAIDVYLYMIEELQKENSKMIENFVVLLPTCPLRTENDIDAACNLFFSNKADSVISYTEESHPIFWHKFINERGTLEEIFPEKIDNRQNYRKSYYPNGAIYVFNLELLREGKYYSDHSYPYLMPSNRSVDIDTLNDFLYAEFLLTKLER